MRSPLPHTALAAPGRGNSNSGGSATTLNNSSSSTNDEHHQHHAISADVLAMVLARLEPREVACARRVCRSWRVAAAAAMPLSFKRHWRLARVIGPQTNGLPPRRGRCALMERAGLESFVRQVHVARGDSILSLALKYGVAPADVKRANGLISDHSLHAHSAVLLPVASRGDLEGACVRLQHAAAANRDVAVLVDDGDEDDAGASDDEEDNGIGEGVGDDDDGGGRAGAGAGGARGGATRRRPQQSARETQRLAQLLSRSMRVDDRAALYYLEAAGGDVKAALSAAAADDEWEDATPGPIRLAPVAAYINGHAGL